MSELRVYYLKPYIGSSSLVIACLTVIVIFFGILQGLLCNASACAFPRAAAVAPAQYVLPADCPLTQVGFTGCCSGWSYPRDLVLYILCAE